MVIGLIVGSVSGYYYTRSPLNADSGNQNKNPATRVNSNPVVVDPKAKLPSFVYWKIDDSKEDKYVCPDGYEPLFPNFIFPGLGTKTDPFYLKYVVNGIVRNGNPFKPSPVVNGPLKEDYVNNAGTALIILPDDRIGKNPRPTSHDGSEFITVDYYQFTNDILPKYLYYPKDLPVKNYFDFDPYIKEAEVVGAKIRKRPYDNSPSLDDICAALGGVKD